MKYGISQLSVVPGREEPSDKAQMVTQVLFGEHYKIIEERSKWFKIRLAYDKYECWIDRKQGYEVSAEVYDLVEKEAIKHVSTELVTLSKNNLNNEFTPILMGSSLPNLTNQNGNWGDFSYSFEGYSTDNQKKPNREAILQHAFMYLNAPYLWGGRGPFGIDCSGFSQIVYKLAGKKLPRDAYQQAEIGQTLSFVEEAEDGDLAFFDNEEGHIIHVGILLNENEIIHASGKVRVDKIDHQGIFNVDTGKYSHKLRLIKKII